MIKVPAIGTVRQSGHFMHSPWYNECPDLPRTRTLAQYEQVAGGFSGLQRASGEHGRIKRSEPVCGFLLGEVLER